MATNFDKITASPEVLADFLASLPCLQGPWDDAFQEAFCADCPAENCDAENCHHQAERNSPAWWLAQIYTGSGPVRTDSPNPYKRQAANLRLEAMHQRDRFGRHLLAQELEGAAASIEELAEKLEAAVRDIEEIMSTTSDPVCGYCARTDDNTEVCRMPDGGCNAKWRGHKTEEADK